MAANGQPETPPAVARPLPGPAQAERDGPDFTPPAAPVDPPWRRAWGLVLVVGFLGGLFVPGALTLLDDDALKTSRAAVVAEQRQPAAWPAAPTGVDDLGQWPRGFESWWNDHFALRATLIRWHNMAKLFGFGTAPSDQVLLGDDGTQPWMYVSLNKPVLDYRGLVPFSDDELRHWQRHLEQRRDWLEARGCRYGFLVAPSKSTIYPEFMPAEQTRVGAVTRLDQLLAWMEAHSDVPVIDLRPALLAAKRESFAGVSDDTPLYYPLGTHWNGLGAWVAYRELMQQWLTPWYGWQTNPLEAYKVVDHVGGGDTWARRFHMEDVLPQPFVMMHWKGPPWVQKVKLVDDPAVTEFGTKGADNGITAVLLRDSFGNALGPHLAPHVKNLSLIWNQVAGPEATLAHIKRKRPRLVLEEVVERYLVGDLPEQWPIEGDG